MAYLEANAGGIADLAWLEATGSGTMEKRVNVLAVHRYKKRGMTRQPSGSNAPLKLRLLKANGEWEEYWAARREAFALWAA